MVSDRFNWINTVTILKPSAIHLLALDYLLNATTTGKKALLTRKLQVNSDTTSTTKLILNILEKQQFDYNIQDIQLMIPSISHYNLYQTLTNFPQTNLNSLTIRDPTDDGFIMTNHHMPLLLQQFLSMTLSKSQLTLTQLDISSFPSNLLVSQYNKYQFPLVKSLKIALAGCQQDGEQFPYYYQYWRQLKSMFPNLQDLTLTLTKENLLLFKFLLQDISLFPWIKRLSIASRETPKNYLSREELRSGLLQLNGLNRITAGWDMVALN
jgi:hypothetical protein